MSFKVYSTIIILASIRLIYIASNLVIINSKRVKPNDKDLKIVVYVARILDSYLKTLNKHIFSETDIY